jgi:hypothetical protein
VTLILTVNGPETIWMLADRRLSYPPPKAPKDDARKFMFYATTDGVAMIGYAGLGKTIGRTEPADWLSAALRMRNCPLDEAIAGLASVIQREFPDHVVDLPGAEHSFVIPAFLNGKARLYTIDLKFTPDRRAYFFRNTRHVVEPPTSDRPERPPRMGLYGSGGPCLAVDKSWMRTLLKLVSACDSGRISPQVVADNLAKINQIAHQNTLDRTVGPQCIVGWRHNRVGTHKGSGAHKGGGGHQFYDGLTRIDDNAEIPSISCGLDDIALIRATTPYMYALFAARGRGKEDGVLDVENLKVDLAKLPVVPNENLK